MKNSKLDSLRAHLQVVAVIVGRTSGLPVSGGSAAEKEMPAELA